MRDLGQEPGAGQAVGGGQRSWPCAAGGFGYRETGRARETDKCQGEEELAGIDVTPFQT